MYGAPDRGGGREGKKKSLRNNKITIVEKVKAQQKGHVNNSGPEVTAQPPAVRTADHGMPLIDCGVQLLNRQFDRDQLKVLQRAATAGVEALVAFTSDFEKAEALTRLAKENTGVVYFMVGVHTDMVKRNNDKISSQRLDQLREFALRPEAVALMAGLDFSRDMGIRYAQERALQQQLELATEVGLPLVLYQVSACEALTDKLQEFRAQQQQQGQEPESRGTAAAAAAARGSRGLQRIAIYNFAGSADELAGFAALDCYIMLSGRVADPAEPGQALRAALLGSCPLQRLLVCSDAPFATPQNIEDAFMREGRNEPSNLPYVIKALAEAYGTSGAAMAAQLRGNSLEFFGLQTEQHAAAAAAAAAATAQGSLDTAPVTSSPDHGESSLRAAAAAAGAVGPSERGGTSARKESEDEGSAEEHANGGAARSRQSRFSAGLAEDSDEGSGEGSEGARTGHGSQGEADARGGRQPLQQQQQQREAGRQRRRNPQPEVVPAKKPTARSYLPETAGEGPRVTYACRSCRSILLSDQHVRPHHAGTAGMAQLDFKRNKKASKSKGKIHDHDDQLCSLYFLKSPLAWMQLPTAGPAAATTTATTATTATKTATATTAAEGEGEAQEGRLVCPCCTAKLGKYDLTGSISCSCGVELPAPAFGLLRARLDLIDSSLDLARAVQSTLQLYEEAEEGGLASSGSDDEQGEKKKKKKQVKGRGNTSNFSSYRNKTFGAAQKAHANSKAAQPSSATEAQIDEDSS